MYYLLPLLLVGFLFQSCVSPEDDNKIFYKASIITASPLSPPKPLIKAKKEEQESVRLIDSATFTGTWYWKDSNENDLVFEVSLEQKKDSIYGIHCAIASGGNRTDCAEDFSIKGTVNNNKASISIISQYSGTEGIVELELASNELVWNMTEVPQEDHYLLDKGILLKR